MPHSQLELPRQLPRSFRRFSTLTLTEAADPSDLFAGWGGAYEGTPWYTANTWTFNFTVGCTQPAQVYCVENDLTRTLPLPTVPPGGRIAFLGRSGGLLGSIGNAALDALCTADAHDAGLPGNYLVARATLSTSALGRFDGGMWYRTDGMPLAATEADLAAARFLVSMDFNARGQFVGPIANLEIWTGATSPGALGTETCGAQDGDLKSGGRCASCASLRYAPSGRSWTEGGGGWRAPCEGVQLWLPRTR